jgi:hypothetical protein
MSGLLNCTNLLKVKNKLLKNIYLKFMLITPKHKELV